MVNYLKNFFIKLLLLPIIALLGGLFLLLFLLHPQFRLIGKKPSIYRREKIPLKDFEPFY